MSSRQQPKEWPSRLSYIIKPIALAHLQDYTAKFIEALAPVLHKTPLRIVLLERRQNKMLPCDCACITLLGSGQNCVSSSHLPFKLAIKLALSIRAPRQSQLYALEPAVRRGHLSHVSSTTFSPKRCFIPAFFAGSIACWPRQHPS